MKVFPRIKNQIQVCFGFFFKDKEVIKAKKKKVKE